MILELISFLLLIENIHFSVRLVYIEEIQTEVLKSYSQMDS